MVVATAVVCSTALVEADAGGGRRRTMQPTPGAAPCTSAVAMSTTSTAISSVGTLSVASGIINKYDNLEHSKYTRISMRFNLTEIGSTIPLPVDS